MGRRVGLRANTAGGAEAASPWYRIVRNEADATAADIDIYDEIHWLFGVNASDFRDELNGLGDGIATLNLHINSPGGDVYEAIAIMNTLRQHKARVVTTVDGLAASSAGFIAVGASDELIMARNAEMMAHLPWAVTIGNAADMRSTADDLDRIGRNIASIFADRAGGDVAEWMDILTAETWWSAEEAVDAGIADRVLPAPKGKDQKAANRFDLSVFNHAGRTSAPPPRHASARNQDTPADVAEVEKRKEPSVALSESALQKLGLDADADEDAINAAIEQIADPAPDLGVDEVAEVAARLGLTLVNATAHQQMQASLAQLEADRAERITAENEAAVTAALRDGRIDAASADTWRELLAANREGTLRLLNTLTPSKAVPVNEIGHGVSREDSAQDAEMATVFAKITGNTIGKDA